MKIELSKPFAPNGKVDEYDTRQVKKSLNRLGYYQPYEKTGITGIPDQAIFDALKKFQEHYGLRATGEARPGDETIQSLNEETAKTPDGYYIWHTVGDDKVRESHQALDNTICSWSDSPNPGEDFNCRCWAELILISPNCRDEQEALNIEKEKFEALNKRKDQHIKDLRKLTDKRDQIVQKMNETLGTEIASFIFGFPFARTDFIFELLQRHFNNIISDELLKAADRLAKERGAILKKIDYTRDQLNIVMIALLNSKAKLEKAQQELKICMNKKS